MAIKAGMAKRAAKAARMGAAWAALIQASACWAAAPSKTVQSGEIACLGGGPAAVSCLDPGLYALAADLSALAFSNGAKSGAARRALDELAAKGSCAANAAVAAAAGGKVAVLRRSFKAKSSAADPQDRAFENEVLGAENVASYKAPPKFKSQELFTGAGALRACK